MSVMVYDLLLARPCEPAVLMTALASSFTLPVDAVNVAEEDAEDRDWTASVLCTYAKRHGDIAMSLSITAIDEVSDRPSEATLALRLAEQLHTPVLYPADAFPPSAYWLADGQNRPARARLEPTSELDPRVDDDLAWTIDAVDRPVPALPRLRVAPIPEVIRENRMPTPLRDSFADQTAMTVGDALWHALSCLGAWEGFIGRMATGWPPDGWYPADYYAEDLGYRDELDELAPALLPELTTRLATALQELDQTYERLTVADGGVALAHALGLSVPDLASRGPLWRRRPERLPWPA